MAEENEANGTELTTAEQVRMWWGVKAELDRLKKLEMEMRNELRAKIFAAVGELEEGTYREDIEPHPAGGMIRLKYVASNTRKLKTEGLAELLDKLEAQENGRLLSDRVVPHKPEFKWGEFQKAPQWFQDELRPFLITTAGAPQLEIEVK